MSIQGHYFQAMAFRCLIFFRFVLILLGVLGGSNLRGAGEVEFWLTTSDMREKLARQSDLTFTGSSGTEDCIRIDDEATFQTILGLGSSLEPTTCSNFWRLAPSEREELMERLVNEEKGIGMNLMRICIGTPDFTGDAWYSYCDLPAGQSDPELNRFSIERDRAYILPVIKLARRKNPALLFFASPWSPPGWMKSNGTMIGGYLLPRWYPVYAQYFVRFVQAYEAEEIPIYAITVQNEPGVDRAREKNPKWHYPSCRWTAEQERDFIRDHLGPALRKAGLRTRIWCYDHNYNLKSAEGEPGLEYPRLILGDPKAAAFIDGVAFHGYTGQPSGMSQFHKEYPNKPIHFTEGSVFGIEGATDLIDRLRNWAVSYNAWVMMLDDKGQPNNGPFDAKYATVALNTKTMRPEYLLDYYLYGQFMKFIPRGAVRIESETQGRVPSHVAFRTSEGHFVLVAGNPAEEERRFAITWDKQSCAVRLPAKSVGTWRW